jgi:hypothetical protein
MTYVSTKRAGKSWTLGEDSRLISGRASGKTYGEIASLKTFKGKRTIKALRRRIERSMFGY